MCKFVSICEAESQTCCTTTINNSMNGTCTTAVKFTFTVVLWTENMNTYTLFGFIVMCNPKKQCGQTALSLSKATYPYQWATYWYIQSTPPWLNYFNVTCIN